MKNVHIIYFLGSSPSCSRTNAHNSMRTCVLYTVDTVVQKHTLYTCTYMCTRAYMHIHKHTHAPPTNTHTHKENTHSKCAYHGVQTRALLKVVRNESHYTMQCVCVCLHQLKMEITHHIQTWNTQRDNCRNMIWYSFSLTLTLHILSLFFLHTLILYAQRMLKHTHTCPVVKPP